VIGFLGSYYTSSTAKQDPRRQYPRRLESMTWIPQVVPELQCSEPVRHFCSSLADCSKNFFLLVFVTTDFPIQSPQEFLLSLTDRISERDPIRRHSSLSLCEELKAKNFQLSSSSQGLGRVSWFFGSGWGTLSWMRDGFLEGEWKPKFNLTTQC